MKNSYSLSTFILILFFSLLDSTRADLVDGCIEAHMRDLHIPGLSLAVVRNGQIIKAQGYGLADMELNVKAMTNTVYEIGSLTKQFTAVAIMMLIEEGKLNLDDRMSKFLTNVPLSWDSITIRQLLNHSSGIQNYLAVPAFPDIHHEGLSHDNITKLFFEKLQLEFQPGETWAYTNSGYLLLGNIIEKLSGMSYWEFLDNRIFTPLGMSATRSSDPNAIIPDRASGYQWCETGFENRPALAENAYAAGAIVSTVLDMAKWDAALYPEELLTKSSLSEMWTPAKAVDGTPFPFNYGFGWFVDQYRGHRVISHGGGTPGFSSVIYRFVDYGLTVIVLSNHADRIIDQLAIDVAGIYLPVFARPSILEIDTAQGTSQILRNTIVDLFEGKTNQSLFTPAMQIFLNTATGKGIWEWVSSDGDLKSFVFAELEEAGGTRILRYRAILGNVTHWFSFTMTSDRQIAQVNWW